MKKGSIEWYKNQTKQLKSFIIWSQIQRGKPVIVFSSNSLLNFGVSCQQAADAFARFAESYNRMKKQIK